MANVFDLIGRILISALFLISAFNKIFNLDGSMSWMEGFGVPGFLIFPTIAIEIILPVLVIVGYQARIAAGILAIFCLATAFIFHFDFSDQAQFISFLKKFLFGLQFSFFLILFIEGYTFNSSSFLKLIAPKRGFPLFILLLINSIKFFTFIGSPDPRLKI